MADNTSDGEVEDEADWRVRVRRLRPFLLDPELVPPPPRPRDAAQERECFASWTRLHAKAPEPPGGFATDAGEKALDALRRDRRQAAPGAFARQCAALGGLDARRSHVLGEIEIPAEDYYERARAAQNARWSRERAARADDDVRLGRWADAVRRYGDALALDATNGDAYRGRATARAGQLRGVTATPHKLVEGIASDVAAAQRHGGPRDGDDELLGAAAPARAGGPGAPPPPRDAVAVRPAAPRVQRPAASTAPQVARTVAPLPPPRPTVPPKRKRQKKDKKSSKKSKKRKKSRSRSSSSSS